MLSSAALMFLINKVPFGIAVCDAKYNIVLWNDTALKMVGEASPKPIYDAEWVAKNRFTTRDGKPITEKEKALYRAIHEQQETEAKTICNVDDKSIYIDTKAYPLYDEGNKNLIGGFAIFQDVTQKIKMEQLLTEIEAKLLELKEYITKVL